MARPLVEVLDENSIFQLAEAVLPALKQAWSDSAGEFFPDCRALELIRLALVAPQPDPVLLEHAADAAARYLFYHQHDARQAQDRVLQPVLNKLRALATVPGADLLLIAFDCAERLGERDAQDRTLEMMQESDVVGVDRGSFLLCQGTARLRCGELGEAEHAFTEAAAAFHEVEAEREWAIARGQIADILMARGELDEALRIRTEEELPVYERLGDIREKAVSQGKIADILMARGELDEALALHEQRLPTAKRLKDIDSIAHIKYATAFLRLQRGDHKTGGMQQIYEDLSVAFDISLKLGRADAIGGIGQLLAQVLAMGGQMSAALEVLQPAQDAFEKIGNIEMVQRVRELREMIARDMEAEE